MKKRIILSTIAAIGFMASSLAQTIVSTTPENKNVVLEEFTGIKCPNCPGGHATASQILNAHPDDVSVIAIHTGYYANPSGSLPDYRTDWGGAIAGQAGVNYFPSGTINRHVFPGTSTMLMGRSQWTSRANQILAQPSYLNIEAKATVVRDSRQMEVLVEVYYTGDSPEETNYLNVALIQDNIYGYQSGGGSNYRHMHMLRDLLTGQWGIPIQNTSANSFYTTTLVYEVPEDVRDIDVVIDDIHLVAFVAESHKDIISGNGAEIVILESTNLDAAIKSTKNLPQTYCGGDIDPVITVHNYGTETLTAFEVEYSFNNETPMTYQWTGSLANGTSTDIALPTLTPSDVEEVNNMTFTLKNPNGNTDEMPGNNIFIETLESCINATQNCKLAFYIPNGANEVTWELTGPNGDVIISDGPYDNDGIYQHPFSFPANGSYTLTVNDAGNDAFGGGGFIKLFSVSKGVIWEADMDAWSSKLVAQFRYGSEGVEDITTLEEGTALYPNPTSESTTLSYTLPQTAKVNIALYDMLGKQVRSFAATQNAGLHQHNIDVSDLHEGLYIVNLDIDGKQITKKINVVK